MASRPGIMLYFDLAEPLQDLSYEEKGRLFEALFNYGQFGVVPEFEGGLKMAWGFIRPKLDADAKKYEEKVLKKTHSSYCAKMKREKREPLDFEEWLHTVHQPISTDIERYPTTSTTPTTTTKTFSIGDRGGVGEEEPTEVDDYEHRKRLAFENLKEAATIGKLRA